jgi:hypothetical protein
MAKKNQTRINYPLARDENVVVESVGDETVIYDLDTHVAHALKPLAAAVYLYADGKNTVAEIAELASYRLATTISESDAEDALAQLDAISMLSSPLLDVHSGMSRRTALKTFAATGASTMLVLSVATAAASACVYCTSIPGYTSGIPHPGLGNIACSTQAFSTSDTGPGGCSYCSQTSDCHSDGVCCCTPCGNTLNSQGQVTEAAYCCQPVCFSGTTCPAGTSLMGVKRNNISCPADYYEYNGNSGNECCAYNAQSPPGNYYTSPYCKNGYTSTGVCKPV